MVAGLSKSKITAFEQCPKRLWLQVHRRELATLDTGAESRFAAGHEVGALACALIPHGIMVEAEPDLAAALTTTTKIMASGISQVIFEATFVSDGVLVRVDVLEPDGNGGWHVAEVKSATSRKDYHLADLATQIWVLRQNGLKISSAAIRHINNRFILAEEGNYKGLLVDAPSLSDIGPLLDNRSEVVANARAVVAGTEPVREIGTHCGSPFICEFQSYCNQNTVSPEWPISLLPSTGKKVAAIWAENGVLELTEVPQGSFSSLVHSRVHEATCTGHPFHDANGAQRATAGWSFPRIYLDFETIAFVVPRWIGTKPWEQVPFQFSAHIEKPDGTIEHREFLSIDGTDPRRRCAEALLQHVPTEGSVIAYSAAFERGCIIRLADLFPDIADELRHIADRLVDLLPVTRNHWYDREQRGSWSIKAVLPTINKSLSYKDLGVQDGSAAQAAYMEAIDPMTTVERRDEIDRDLRTYCGVDTEAMIVLLHRLIN